MNTGGQGIGASGEVKTKKTGDVPSFDLFITYSLAGRIEEEGKEKEGCLETTCRG